MIEFPITLTSGGSVCMPGHAYALALGYTKNRGVYRLHVDATGEWEGLAIRAFWHVPDGKAPSSSLVVDGYVDVPASVTAQPGNGCITFEGSDGTKTVTSADLHYRVSANSGTEDGATPEPGTPAWQQLVGAVHTDATAAEQAKIDAQTAASEAATSAGSADQSAQKAAGSLQELKDGIANGDFKGEPGNDGKSPVVAVTDIENGHRVSITDKDGTKTIDVLNGQTGKTGATPVLTIGTVSSGDKPSADITGTPENPVLNLILQPGPQGPAVALDTTLTHEGEAADAKATGDAISAVKARQNILIGSETGNPIAVDDAFHTPLCGLTVYGKSTQDGTPTPDAPVPIVSAGDSGSVAVKVTGKNLLYLPDIEERTVDGVTYSVKNGVIKAKGAYTGQYGIRLSTLKFPVGTFIFNSNAIKGTESTNRCLDLTNNNTIGFSFHSNNLNTPKRLTENDVSYEFFLMLQFTTGDMEWQPQMLLSDKPLPYSPYREQLLTLPTPTSLPGIPVTSGGNYTDQSGQQWVCDEVDLERGVKVQRVGKGRVNTNNGSVNEQYRLALDVPGSEGKDGASPCIISITPYTSWTSCVAGTKLYLKNIAKSEGSFYTAEELKALAIDVDFVYQLATPIETPLTPAEIGAYKVLTAYGPDTVVQAGDGAGVKLEYQRDVNIAIKRIEDAIASMT